MKLTLQSMVLPLANVWEDLVSDFLEMACFLKNEESGYLMAALREEKIRADAIRVYPCFSLDNRVIVICEDTETSSEEPRGPKSVWLFYPKQKRIRKPPL